tara:strand:+ start:42 stop:530 length:489 start_codon:yes stop_codon:yes gene_type:complete
MPQFLTNPTTNSVVYSPGTWTTKILGTTQQVTNSETLVSVPEFKIALGKYERMLIKYRIHWKQNTTGRIKFKLDTPTVVTGGIHTAWTGIDPTGAEIHQINQGVDPTLDQNIAGEVGYLEIEEVIENDATAGDINLQFAQYDATSATTADILRGSYVEYRRF